MAITRTMTFAAGDDHTTSNYDAIGARLRIDEDPPAGLVVHAAGFSGDTFEIVEVWESAEHADRFARERLMPAVTAVVGDGGVNPTTRTYELHDLVVPRP
ncbi:hypothetical protein [Conexibacter sp. SYSU D00693]|uniref:hypothetical protein n=1 Tax=Conexibacter sp. SYSU D00693 TaxID=2812560 RepID=UPI00196B5167|nr:hypothetical protein [Conexibacter sp. SYSU D00693]